MKAYIEEDLKDSIISSNVKFSSTYWNLRELIKYRRNNMKSTDMAWITLRAVIDSGLNLYNPQALIFIILN